MINMHQISHYQQVNYRLETRNEGGSVKMEMVLSPDLEQEMLLSNIKHSQQVVFIELLFKETLFLLRC